MAGYLQKTAPVWSAISNQLNVINGGVVSNVGYLYMSYGSGGQQGSGYNSLIVTGASSAGVGSAFIMTPGIGRLRIRSSSGRPCGGGNKYRHPFQQRPSLGTTQGNFIGNGSSNNTVTLLPNTSWNQGGNTLAIGENAANGNVLTVSGGVLSNVGDHQRGLVRRRFRGGVQQPGDRPE